MLNLTDMTRKFLQQTGALVRDCDGQEVMLGLTYAESVFLVAYLQASEIESLAERQLFFQLRSRHLCARLQAIGLARHLPCTLDNLTLTDTAHAQVAH